MCGERCIAGMTFSRPILAVLMMPKRTGSMATSLVPIGIAPPIAVQAAWRAGLRQAAEFEWPELNREIVNEI